MPAFGPIKRHDLIYFLRRLGFVGPYAGGKHQFMIRETVRVRIPNPHREDIGTNLLREILREAAIERSEWESLK